MNCNGCWGSGWDRAEVLTPVAYRNFWPRFDPETKLMQVGDADVAIAHALDEMLADSRREIVPDVNLGH